LIPNSRPNNLSKQIQKQQKNIDNKYCNNANKKFVKFTYIIKKYASKKCF